MKIISSRAHLTPEEQDDIIVELTIQALALDEKLTDATFDLEQLTMLMSQMQTVEFAIKQTAIVSKLSEIIAELHA